MRTEFPFSWFLAAFAAYTLLLFFISYLTGRGRSGRSFFKGDRKAPWPVVAFGMIGASISGVTFISVPGNVWVQNFFYMPMVLGFVLGYIIVAKVLLPLYYRRDMTSIYAYLDERFGPVTMRTGTTVFMISRLLGAAVRIFVVIVVFLTFIPSSIGGFMPSPVLFVLVAAVFLGLIYLYTYRGGVKTIIWTDVLQTAFMLLAVGIGIVRICMDMGWGFTDMLRSVAGAVNPNEAAVGAGKPFVSWFDWDWSHGTNAVKQFISGAVVTVAMTGLDQSMMQKNLACKDLKAAQKNMYTTSIIIVVVNLFFLLLGALLCVYASSKGGFEAMGVTKTDQLFPMVASGYLGKGVGLCFLIGLISASYPSAAGAMTSLTTSVCCDFLGFTGSEGCDVARQERLRKMVQGAVALCFLLIMSVLFVVSNDAVINLVYKLASYTYGPLLGIFFFGILSSRKGQDKATPAIALASPLVCLIFNMTARRVWNFDLGFSLLLVNALLCFILMWAFSKKSR